MLELRQLHQLQAAGILVRRNKHLGVLVPRLHQRDPRPPPPSGIEVSTGIAQTVALCYVSSQDGGKQEVKSMVQDSVKSSLTQLGVIPQDAPTQSLTRKIPILGADYDSFPSPVATRVPLWKFTKQTPSGSQTQPKTATTQAQSMTTTPVNPADPQKQAPAQTRPQAEAQAHIS